MFFFEPCNQQISKNVYMLI